MAKIRFKNNKVEDYTIVLTTRDRRRLGQLNGIKDVVHAANLNSANEMSFTVYKNDLIKISYDNKTEEEIKKLEETKKQLWENIVDFKLIWVKELNEYFEITVTLDDATDTYKTITATSLCEAELSQINIYSTEINTDADIERKDYVATTFYNPENPKASLLHRVLQKAPHYKIYKVAASLHNIQRTFSIDGTSIYDFLVGDCAKEFGCIFKFDSTKREISVYDLYTRCNNCNERGEFGIECPKCGSKNLSYYGDDTTIYIDKNNLTDSIHYEENTDNIKNCFKLEAGDEDITATVRELNQNGSDYIYYINEYQKKDMPKELVDKLNSYDKLYASRTEEYEGLLGQSYDLQDKIGYYEHSMMPDIEHAEVTAKTEVAKLTKNNLNYVAISNVTKNSDGLVATVNRALLNYAKVFVKTGFVKLEIDEGSTFTYVGKDKDEWDYGTWKGRFKVTNYSDEKDIAYSADLTLTVNDNYHKFIEQKVKKQIASKDDESTIFDVIGEENLSTFEGYLKEYSLNRLKSFYDAIQSGLDVLIEADQAKKGADLFESLYSPYYKKLIACQSEMTTRQKTINGLEEKLESVQKEIKNIQDELNFEKYLGDLYNVFCAYRREDKYTNSNYVSDGLSNAERINKAKEFLKVAKEELQRSSEKQITITTTLYNLLVMKEFEPLVEHFELGNWLRIKVDGQLYRLRLIGYEINFEDLQTINVTFSTVTKIDGFMSDVDSILSSAKSMATSYDATTRQAEQGNKAQGSIKDWIEKGLNSALINIKNSRTTMEFTDRGLLGKSYDDITGTYGNEQVILTGSILGFTKDNWETVECALGKHDFTYYNEAEKKFVTSTDYGLTSKFVQSGYVMGSQIIGGDIYSDNYSSANKTGTHINLREGKFSLGESLSFDGKKIALKNVTLDWNSTNSPSISNVSGLQDSLNGKSTTYTSKPSSQRAGDLLIPSSTFTATYNSKTYTFTVNRIYKCTTTNSSFNPSQWSDTIANTAYSLADNAKTIGDTLVNGLGFQETEITGSYVISPVIAGGYLLIGDKNGTHAEISTGGTLKCRGAEIAGKITTGSGTIGGWNISTSLIYANRLSDDEKTTYSAAMRDASTSMAFAVYYKDGDYRTQAPSRGAGWDYNFYVSYAGKLYSKNAEITGVINANSGKIGNWTITKNDDETDSFIYASNTISGKKYYTTIKSGGQVAIGIGAPAYDTTTGANIQLYHNGKAVFRDIEIAGGSININDKFKVDSNGNVTLPSNAKITWSQISDGESNVTSITEDTIKTTNVTANNLKVKFANITGTITATNLDCGSGTIGGWEITSNSLIQRDSSDKPLIFLSGTGSQSGNYTVGSHTGKDWYIWANSKFGVTNTGKLYASGAEITGKITATDGEFTGKITSTSGEIGGWIIDGNKLVSHWVWNSDTDSFTRRGTGMGATSGDGDPAFYAGFGSKYGKTPWLHTKNEEHDKSWTEYTKFYVTNAGKLVAKNVEITGGSITIGGTTFTSNGLTLTASSTKVGSKTLGTYVGDIVADKITADYINSTYASSSISLNATTIHSNVIALYETNEYNTNTILLNGKTGNITCTKISVGSSSDSIYINPSDGHITCTKITVGSSGKNIYINPSNGYINCTRMICTTASIAGHVATWRKIKDADGNEVMVLSY